MIYLAHYFSGNCAVAKSIRLLIADEGQYAFEPLYHDGVCDKYPQDLMQALGEIEESAHDRGSQLKLIRPRNHTLESLKDVAGPVQTQLSDFRFCELTACYGVPVGRNDGNDSSMFVVAFSEADPPKKGCNRVPLPARLNTILGCCVNFSFELCKVVKFGDASLAFLQHGKFLAPSVVLRWAREQGFSPQGVGVSQTAGVLSSLSTSVSASA